MEYLSVKAQIILADDEGCYEFQGYSEMCEFLQIFLQLFNFRG